jgi:hypothetical protein
VQKISLYKCANIAEKSSSKRAIHGAKTVQKRCKNSKRQKLKPQKSAFFCIIKIYPKNMKKGTQKSLCPRESVVRAMGLEPTTSTLARDGLVPEICGKTH